MKEESRETDNIRHKNRAKTNKTEVTTQKTKTKEESREEQDKQNRSYNTEN